MLLEVMTLQHVTINGHEVAYHTSGTGPVLLLVHGMAGSSATWAHVTPALGERFTVVAPDLLGPAPAPTTPHLSSLISPRSPRP
jgi:pimeloyl-ACP methyl ester carboxylesterase